MMSASSSRSSDDTTVLRDHPDSSSASTAVPSIALSVMNLKYIPSQNFIAATMRSDEAAVLENVTFSVESGELMAVLAPQDAERR